MPYLKGTIYFGIQYCKHGSQECIGYSNADWAGDLDNQRSISGYSFLISGDAVTWKSKEQPCVALSTAEAEFMALANAAQEAIRMRQLTIELGNTPAKATTIYENNQVAISLTKNPQFHGQSKHIGIKYHFIRDLVTERSVRLKYCPTREMIADILTQGLNREQLFK